MANEMDRSKLKRPEIQTQRQISKTTFGNTEHVPKAIEGRPRVSRTDGIIYPSRPLVRPVAQQLNSIQQTNLVPQNHLDAKPPLPELVAKPVTALPTPHVQRSPLDMSLPGEESHLHQIRLMRQKKWRRVRSVTAKTTAIVLIMLITMGGLLFSQTYFKLNKVFRGSTGTVAALKANVAPDLLKGEGSGRVNILLLGRGGGTHDGPDLTDSMMVASIDPVNYTTTLISIPRDLWVNVPNAGVMKINAAWETGEFHYLNKISTGSTDPKAISAGFDSVDQTLSNVLGINIDYNVLVNFQAFQQAVDTVGGVTVNVPTPLIDPTMAWENNNNPVLAQAGIQNFDGSQALTYVRSRETTSDFARAVRQRSVLVALKDKIETLGTLSNPLKISGLINAFGNNVQTDLSLSDASRVYSIEKKVTASKITSVGFDAPNQYVTTGNIAGQSIVLPTAGLFNYGGIQQYVRGLLKDPYLVKENAKILVLNGTIMPGLATNAADQLKTYGYNVIGTGNTPTGGWLQTTVVNLTSGKDKYTQHFLEERYGVQASSQLNDKTIPTNGADFVIIIGSNEANITQTQAN